MKFEELTGDDLGVYHDDNYQLVQCYDGHIVLSYARKGRAMTAHIASDKIGLRNLKEAIDSFCQWIFDVYRWCRFIFAAISKRLNSMERLVIKCGFKYLISDESHHIYERAR